MNVLSRGCQATQVAWGEVVAGDLRSQMGVEGREATHIS